MLPKLKGDTFFIPLPDGIYFRNKQGSFKIKGAEQQKERGRKTDPRTMKRVIQAFYPYRSEAVTVLAAILVASLLGLVPPFLISYVFDDAIGKGNGTHLFIYVAFMAAALVFSGIIGVGQAHLSNQIGQKVTYNFRNQLYQHLQSMPMSSLREPRTGEIQSHLSNDISEAQGTVTNTANNLVSDLIITVSTIIAMIVISPLLTLITLGLFPLFVWIIYKVGDVRRQMGTETQGSMARLTAQMEETLSASGILQVKAFGQQKHAQAQFQQENQKLTDLTLRQLLIGRWLIMLITTFFALTPVLIYLVAGEQIIQHVSVFGDAMTLGKIVAFTALQFRLFFPLGALTGLLSEFQGALALFDRIFEYLDLPSEMQDKPDALHLTAERVQGEVTFRNVTFSYKENEYSILTDTSSEELPDNGETKPPAPSEFDASPDLPEETRPALKNTSFTIKPGQLAALVGPGGAGKTTITYLLPRLYDAESGAVEIDGINVKDIAQASLGELIGVVTQEIYLFHASMRENLLYARPDATEEEMIAAAQAAAIDERIMELEDGYDTIVGERGYKLSDSEKQRVAIARAVLKNPRILILDEATRALDTRSERLIQTALETLMRGRTTLAIAQRLSTILAADVILVVNKGEIVERGTHQELLASGGLYAQLYHEWFSQPSVGTGLAPVPTIEQPTPTIPHTISVFKTQTADQETAEVTTIEQPTPTIPHTISVFKIQTADQETAEVTTIEQPTPTIPHTISVFKIQTANQEPAEVTTIEQPSPTTPHTISVFETQTADQELAEVTTQEKTASPTGMLPIRVASKEDILSTTHLPPSVREIFVSTFGKEQEASPSNTSLVAPIETKRDDDFR